MPVLKPTRGLRLNKSHPLARGLVGCWLMNEGSGNKVFDLSGNGNNGTLIGTAPSWSPGKFGSAVLLPYTDEYVDVGDKDLFSSAVSVISWVKQNNTTDTEHTIISKMQNTGTYTGWEYMLHDPDFANDSDGIVVSFINDWGSADRLRVYAAQNEIGTTWHQLAFTYDGSKSASGIKIYLDEISKAVSVKYDTLTGSVSNSINLRIGARDTGRLMNGLIDHVILYNRALSASEIALLYREPFCMFARAGRSELIGGQIVNFAGTSAALSSLSATAKAMRKVGGNVASISDVEALLNSIRGRLETERNWLREALFNGMTANAFKLGTTLSLGWFWVRIASCSVLYRGSGMEEIDFVNILAVAEQDAYETSPPSYIPHNSGSTYFYVVRRFNNCGYQECTLAAAVKVSIDSNGELAEPQPNKVFDSGAELVDGNKIQLVWFYCPLAQKLQPVCFNVYYDNRTGQINYQNPLATISYKGRKFYSFQSSTLEAGKYLFAIRAEDAGGIENSSLARLRIQLDTAGPEAVDILRAEAV